MFAQPACPVCQGPVREAAGEIETASIVLLTFADLPAWGLAAIFVALGWLWWPGYLIGIVIILWFVFRRASRKRTHYCPLCRENFTADEVIRGRKNAA